MTGEYGFEKINIGMAEAKGTYRDAGKNVTIAECSDNMALKLFESLEAENWQSVCTERYGDFLEKSGSSIMLLFWCANEEVNFLCLSNTRRTRALEFLDYIITEFGLVKGGVNCASGRVASVIFSIQMSDNDIDSECSYIMKRAGQYFEETCLIDAGDYAKTHKEEIEKMPVYHKKRIAWAYVKTTDVVEKGKKLWVKSLENSSGFEITSSDDIYIMIGSRGEIYDIKREKFENSYDAGEEQLDVFEQLLDFLPAVETLPEREYIALDEKAKLCYPKPGAGIKACRLSSRTKIFPVNGDDSYHLGSAGDYMAVRLDDESDIYVIQSDIFERTYELTENE